jgi:signal transduction histidine kinase/DNA-binding NarL/FixJ family response regulator
MPALLQAQVDLSELQFGDLAKMLSTELKTLKAVEARSDKPSIAHSQGTIGEIYLYIAKRLNDSEVQNETITRNKKTYLTWSCQYSEKAIATGEEIGDIEQLRSSYKNLSAAQKMNGDLKAALKSYGKMAALKKNVFNAKKNGEIEKKQLEYMHGKREDSLRQQQKLAEEHLKTEQVKLAQQQRLLEDAHKTLSASEEEKLSVTKALKKSQADLSFEKMNAQEKEKLLALAEQEKSLQATNIKLAESKLELQQSELQLQQNRQKLLQDELDMKERRLGLQRTYIYLTLGGFLVLAVCMFFIVRERKKAIQQKLRAERSEKFKQDFIANISHEIRTPMNAINGMTSLLLHKDPRPEQENYLKAITKSADILLHVINDVLDLSKIEAGKLELEKIDFSVSDMVTQVKDTLAYRAEDKGLQLVTTVDDKLDDVLVGDPYRLNQILINLGGNALKFTEKGGVEINVSLEARDGDHVLVKYAISDTGIGIPADKLNKLFANFSQINSSDTRKYGGTGLGLSISKHLVELQGGTILVESTFGKGTTFSFMIKYPVGSTSRLQQRIAAEQNSDGTILNGLRILIADDNEYNRMVVDETLHLVAKLHTELVVNGQEAVEAVEKNHYDLILMDVQMPVMNGTDATRKIRATMPSPKNQIPIVALTASVLRADLDECFSSGMTAYVPKPFKTWQLINTIAEVTGRERLPETTVKVQQQPQPVAAPAVNTEDFSSYVQTGGVTNLDYLTKFCEGDQKRMHKYIKVYLNALPAFYKNIEAAVETKDFTEVALHVHSFKPKFMMMGMKQTNELGIKIDQMCKAQNEKAFEDLKMLIGDVEKSVKELENVSLN